MAKACFAGSGTEVTATVSEGLVSDILVIVEIIPTDHETVLCQINNLFNCFLNIRDNRLASVPSAPGVVYSPTVWLHYFPFGGNLPEILHNCVV